MQTAAIIITLALVFYSIGVWAEKIQGRLKYRHLFFFICGLVCDTIGTGMMFDYAGGITYDLHGLTGMLAIVLMFIHAVWAAIVLIKKNEKWIVKFHRFSIFVWIVWLVPYFSPMIFAITNN